VLGVGLELMQGWVTVENHDADAWSGTAFGHRELEKLDFLPKVIRQERPQRLRVS